MWAYDSHISLQLVYQVTGQLCKCPDLPLASSRRPLCQKVLTMLSCSVVGFGSEKSVTHSVAKCQRRRRDVEMFQGSYHLQDSGGKQATTSGLEASGLGLMPTCGVWVSGLHRPSGVLDWGGSSGCLYSGLASPSFLSRFCCAREAHLPTSIPYLITWYTYLKRAPVPFHIHTNPPVPPPA